MQNPHHIWSVLCQKTIIDKDSGNASLIEVFERLVIDVGEQFLKELNEQPNGRPIQFPHAFELVNLWHRGERVGQVATTARLELLDPTGKVLNTFDYQVDIKPEMTRHRVNVRFPGLLVTRGGTYWFKISVKEDQEAFQEVTRVPLEIVNNFPKPQ